MTRKTAVLLDTIAALTSYAYISDLVSSDASAAVKAAVAQIHAEDYPLVQWIDAANYILQNDISYETPEQARQALL